MKIIHKLLAGYFLVALLACIVGYVGVRLNTASLKAFDDVSGDVLPLENALDNLRFQGLRMVSSSVELVYLRGLGARQQYQEERESLSRSRVGLQGSLAVCRRMMAGERNEASLLSALEQSSSLLQEKSDTFVRMGVKGASNAAMTEEKERFEDAERHFLEAVDKALQHEMGELAQSKALVHDELRGSLVVIPAVTALTFLLAFGCGAAISANIARRVKRLKQGVDLVSEGTLEVRLNSRSSDELGTLAGAFNEMVEELRRSKEEIVTTSSYLDRIIHSMVDSLFVVSADGIIKSVNPATCHMLHYKKEELVGQPLAKVFLDAVQCEAILDTLSSDGIIREVETSCRTREGEAIPVSFSASKMDNPAFSSQHRVCIAHNITLRKQAEQEIQQLAYYDQLTGLPNRLLFGDRLRQGMARAQRDKSTLALLFFDLDRFKDINDTLGHACGDFLLQEVSRRIETFVRRSDTLARLGGDEFVLLCSGPGGDMNAEHVAKKLMELFEIPFDLEGNEVYVTASIGIVFYPTDGDDATTLLRNADLAMYAAKEMGRNAYQFFSDEMNLQAQERKQLEDQLRKAFLSDQFTLHYQPQIDLASGRLYGVEALLRWSHPERGMIPPSTFIPIAEQTGMIRSLGEWVLREACRQGKSWMNAGYPLVMAVNVSGCQFLHPAFHNQVKSILKETGLEPALLELEITESVFMADPRETAQSLRRLKELQVRLAVDDFGTGYSSLSYLMDFPLDRLKIDKSFIRSITNKTHSAVIVDAVIAMGHSLGLRVLAEGVETVEELAYLRGQGCDEVQGYLFARPMPAGELQKLLGGMRLGIPSGRGKEEGYDSSLVEAIPLQPAVHANVR